MAWCDRCSEFLATTYFNCNRSKWNWLQMSLTELGEGGIRTLGTVNGFCGFQDRRIQPLCHLSKLYFTRVFAFCPTSKRAFCSPFAHRLLTG
jgi:hypothetical protein